MRCLAGHLFLKLLVIASMSILLYSKWTIPTLGVLFSWVRNGCFRLLRCSISVKGNQSFLILKIIFFFLIFKIKFNFHNYFHIYMEVWVWRLFFLCSFFLVSGFSWLLVAFLLGQLWCPTVLNNLFFDSNGLWRK